MLDRIQAFLHNLGRPETTPDFEPGDPRVAFVALCFQVMEADGQVSQEERRRLGKLLRDRYDLSDNRLKELLSVGRQAGSEAIDYHRFTSDLKRHLNREEDRIELVAVLWDIVYADGERSEIEDHVIWRIADLLGVKTRDSEIASRNAFTRARKIVGETLA